MLKHSEAQQSGSLSNINHCRHAAGENEYFLLLTGICSFMGMCVCVCVCVFVCVRAWMHVSVCLYMCVCVYIQHMSVYGFVNFVL